MMAIIPRTDFSQGQFAFRPKNKFWFIENNQAPTKKIVSLSETSRKWTSLAFKFT